MQDGRILCFSQRILNPFRGAMHVVRTRWAEAVTTDGREWTLYVQGECIYDDMDEEEDVIVPDIKYGTWSERSGFQRAPIRLPTFERTIARHGEHLLDMVRHQAPALPFPLADHHELWLLHGATGRPLALLASRCDHQAEEVPPLLRWTPGEAGIASDRRLGELREAVSALAGERAEARWFDRRHARLPVGDLDARALAEHAEALAALRHWQSPATLLLALERDERRDLEALAARHALRLAELLPLYPEVVDEARITAALVEARMRRACPEPASSGEETLSPFYLEM